ncbi:MAG: YceI family protein [Bacteroidales bacterium]|nr:YceI family protein [Bacteroidales bacterium]MCF8403134.1 YceI family protein [Bacteroidales bacterium]
MNIIFIIGIFIIPQIWSQSDTEILYQVKNGSIVFISEAPLELISAKSDRLEGLVDPLQNTFAFKVSTGSFIGFNSPLQQEHFYENYIESDKYPYAHFTGKIIEKIDFNNEGTYKVRAKGILDIHGVKKERIIECTIINQRETFTVNSSFIVSLDEHNITVPKIVFQKIAQDIRVKIELKMLQTSTVK